MMEKPFGTMESNECQIDPWDDTLLVKAYDDSIKLAREELARRIALSTSKDDVHGSADNKSKPNSETVGNTATKVEYNIGDYVRATYEDGVDYEGKIISIDRNSKTCVLKYIGYENEQNIPLSNLIASWGKKARRLQFAKAKLGDGIECPLKEGKGSSKTSKRSKIIYNLTTIPPPPPMPPMLSAAQNCEDSEHLSAMLMSWYMSGYYTGVYQGMQMAKSGSKVRKQ